MEREEHEQREENGDGGLEMQVAESGTEERKSEAEIEEPAEAIGVGRIGLGEEPIADEEECRRKDDEVVRSEVGIHEDGCDEENCEANAEGRGGAPTPVKEGEDGCGAERVESKRNARPGQEKLPEGAQRIHLVELGFEHGGVAREISEGNGVIEERLFAEPGDGDGGLSGGGSDAAQDNFPFEGHREEECGGEAKLGFVEEKSQRHAGKKFSIGAEGEISERESDERDGRILAEADHVEEPGKRDGENGDGGKFAGEIGHALPDGVTTQEINRGAERNPKDRRPRIRENRERRVDERDLRTVNRQIVFVLEARDGPMRERGLALVIVEKGFIAMERDFAEDIFVNEIGAFDLTEPIVKAGVGEAGRVSEPDDDGEHGGVAAHALACEEWLGFGQSGARLQAGNKSIAGIRDAGADVSRTLSEFRRKGNAGCWTAKLQTIDGRAERNHLALLQGEFRAAPMNRV